MNLASRIAVPRRAALAATSILVAAGAMAIAASPALATDTSGLTMTATATQGDHGAPLTVTYSAPATTPAALSAFTLDLPISWNPGVFPEFNTGNSLGTVTITPAAGAPIVGQITATDPSGNPLVSPAMVVTFPGFTLNGPIDINNHGVSFSGLPNVAFTSIVLAINGGPTSPVLIKCQTAAGNVTSTATGQDSSTTSLSGALAVAGCPAAATGGKVSGAGSGKPTVSFSLAGTDGGALTAFTVKLPSGLSLVNSKLLRKSVTVGGGNVSSVKVAGGKLVVTLAAPTPKVTVKIGPGALKVTTALEAKIKHHRTKSLAGTVTTDNVSAPLALAKVS